MKCLIVNAKHIEYPSKKTGELMKAIVLDLVCNDMNSSSGKKVTTSFIYSNVALYGILTLSCNSKFEELNNLLCNIEYDNSKNIVGFDFIKTDSDKPAVTWRF